MTTSNIILVLCFVLAMLLLVLLNACQVAPLPTPLSTAPLCDHCTPPYPGYDAWVQ